MFFSIRTFKAVQSSKYKKRNNGDGEVKDRCVMLNAGKRTQPSIAYLKLYWGAYLMTYHKLTIKKLLSNNLRGTMESKIKSLAKDSFVYLTC